MIVGPANRHESTKFIDVMEDVRKMTGKNAKEIRSVHADSGYDTKVIRNYLRAREMADCIPHRQIGNWKGSMSQRDTVRYVVERFFAWLKNGFHRLRIRYERKSENYLELILKPSST